MTAELGALARAAGAAWGGLLGRPVLVQARENAVFRAQLADGTAVALRLHRAGYNSARGIEAELLLCERLADAGFACPWPWRTRAGGFTAPLPDGRCASIVSWVAGRPLGSVPATELPLAPRWRAVGALLADFHASADAVAPELPDRPDWGAAALTGTGIWGDPLADPGLAAEDRALLARARAAAADMLAGFGGGDLGVIHGDPLADNMLSTEAGLVLIDFDDCGPGFRAYDLATALIGLAGSPDLAPAAGALADGYRAAGGPASEAALEALPLFAMLRAQASSAWAQSRCPQGDARRAAYRSRALALSRAWLGGGRFPPPSAAVPSR
ncbi:phosphotransferase enzyme family protein [Poseidonocella sp. HB161398]|uniref:phosphotransferase enzyme family protein n=1 Tax=Poseidonocella sp. HB161398 TaxID=2320855 RepID=UPI001485D2A7|nr:phosphotransferase [Poseidonocella sp. HB161398]